MMNFGSYINQCVDENDLEELQRCWYWLGSKKATKDTPMYIRDSLYLIDAPGAKYDRYLFYCNGNYMGKINWDEITVYSQAMKTTTESGVTVECFQFLDKRISNTSEVLSLIEGVDPFTKYVEESSDIIIDTDTYYQIMSCVGVPFIRESELEYNRQAILKLAVEPALRAYYAEFPIEEFESKIIEGKFDIKLPKMAMNAVVEYSGGIGTQSVNVMAGMGAHTMGMSYASGRMGGGQFGSPVYIKPVPGWSGLEGGTSAIGQAIDGMTFINSLRSMSTKNRADIVRRPDGRHLVGYSNYPCTLSLTWLKWSRDWEDADPGDFDELFRLCQAGVKRALGPIYALLQDNTLPVNSKELKQEGNQEWLEIVKEWKGSAATNMYTTSKGGLLF